MDNPRSILITGASSGIGEALALEYAAPGIRLWLGGRDRMRLEDVAQRCRAAGAEAEIGLHDVADRGALEHWVAACDGAAPLDLAIANAGIAAGGPDGDDPRRIFAVNIDGVVNTVLPALERMRRRRRGQIALVSSLASFRGLPGAAAYSASKGAVRIWGEGLRGRYRDDGIAVSVICPGFVVSRITGRNEFAMPMLMTAEKSARIIRRGLARNRGRIAFPWPMYAGSWLLSVLPPALADRLLRNAPRKE